MTTERPLVEKVLDLVLYAPVGLALQLRADADRVVGEGRTEVLNRVTVARWVGEMAVHIGRRTVQERFAPPVPATGPAGPARPFEPDAAEPAPVVEAGPPLEAPFEGYDSLAAAQVVQLLERLPDAELRMVQSYESAGRGRRTILAKIDQLLDH